MSARNIWRWTTATMLMALLIGHAPSGLSQVAQTSSQDTAAKPMYPDAARVAAALDLVRGWLSAPEFKTDLNSAFEMPGVTAVCVILRHNGRVLGIGEDAHGDDRMLAHATAAAMEKLRADPVIAGMSADVQKIIGPSLCIEIEAAGAMSPLIGRTLPQMSSKLEPGLDGFAIRRNDQWQALFPAQLRATNSADDFTGRMLGAAMKSGLQANDLRDLSKKTDTTFYRFNTIHLVQVTAEGKPFQTYRGDALVRADSINRDGIRGFAEGLVSHLCVSLWPDPPMLPGATPATAPARKPLGLMGDYRVVSDDYRPLFAGPMEQSLAAFALARYSQCASINMNSAQAALKCARQILIDLAQVADGETDPAADPAACAAIVYAVSSNPSLAKEAAINSLFSRACNSVQTSFDPAKNSFLVSQGNGQTAELSPHAQAMIAGAMCRLLTARELNPADGLPLDAQATRAAMDRAWNSVMETQRIALLPWMGWAESDFAQVSSQPISHIEDLRRIASVLDKSRIGSNTPQKPLDLWGGFEFATDDGPLRPDSQSARPAAWIASILADSRLIPTEHQASALDGHLLTVRFLVQMTIREPARYSLRNPSAALGGMRASAWNSQQPVAAQAMALLAAAETLDHLARPTAVPAKP